MRKICVVVTARPSYSRIKTALKAIQAHPDLELQLVVAASALLERYGTVARYIEDDGFEIAARVYMVLEGENLTAMAKTTGLGLLELATVFDNLKPDVIVTIADRYETLATAIAASYMNIPVAHVQGGEVTGSIDEKVRHAVTKLSDLHFVATRQAAERVIRMGEGEATVFVTGCPSIDLAADVLRAPKLDFDPFERYGGVGVRVDLSAGYLVVIQHPVTTEYESARRHILETLHAVGDTGLPALWFWPNVDAGSDGTSNGIRAFRELEKPANIHFFKNMTPTDFLRLIYNSRGLVGNTSVGIREASYLGVPVVNIGSRQGGRDRGSNVLNVGYDRREIAAAIQNHRRNSRYPQDSLYGDGRAGERIARLLAEAPMKIEKEIDVLMRVLGLIPARGGSKGIPRKNINLLNGKPLLQYTAEAALLSRHLSKTILGTDDDGIAEVGRRCGLQIPFKRPTKLGQDDTPMLDVVQHAVRWMEAENECFDSICLLQPTNPLRRAQDIDSCIELLERSDADTVVTVLPVPLKYNPHWVYFSDQNSLLHLSIGEPSPIPRRQDLPLAFHREGSIYVTRRNVVMEDNSIYGKRVIGYLLDPEQTVNIDAPEDWVRAESLLATMN